MHPSFLLRQIVILFNLRFSIICISLRLNSRCSLLFLFTISSTFSITYRTPNRKNAIVLSRLIYFFLGDNACNKKRDRCVYVLGILQYAAKLDLIDAWRVLNQDARRYSWRRRNPEIHCRLDFFLVSQDTDISAGYKTDHSLITIKIAHHSNIRGAGFWKLNTSFLKETEYINQIRETIEQVKPEYREDKYVYPALMWEMIKLTIREKSIRYAKSKRSRMLREE